VLLRFNALPIHKKHFTSMKIEAINKGSEAKALAFQEF